MFAKKMFLIATLLFGSSVSMASKNLTVSCEHAGFSDMVLEIEFSESSAVLTVVEQGFENTYSPKRGEVAKLRGQMNQDFPQYIRFVGATENSRNFQFNAVKSQLQAGFPEAFDLTVNISNEDEAYPTFVANSLSCVRVSRAL